MGSSTRAHRVANEGRRGEREIAEKFELPQRHRAHGDSEKSYIFGFLKLGDERKIAADYTRRLQIRCDSPRQLAGRLSGGNQQKVVIAKWLVRGARVFLFDEPTRGIDEVFEVMDSLARSGAAVLMVSSEMSELLQVADRILVMRQGQISGELPGKTTQENIKGLAAPDRTTSEERPQ